jgi:hypothetical protein
MQDRTRNRIVALFSVAAVAVGVAAPAFAEGNRTSSMSSWSSGDASHSWYDGNTDSDATHVTFYDCTREFKATIRKTVTGGDPSYGSEWIDCKAYVDAVSVGDVAAGDYHFDVTDFSGTTSVNKLVEYW